MHKLLVVPAALALVACTEAPPPVEGDTAIELRNPTIAIVSGNSFDCTGTWPSTLTPCGYRWESHPTTTAVSDDPDVIQLHLARSPIPVDGGASTVDIDLRFFGQGVERHIHSAAAETRTTMAGLIGVSTISAAQRGWVQPAVVGDTADQRNAGLFFLDFGWGTITGTYDTAAP